MSDPRVIYLAPACHEEHMQREWCEDDVWPACEECGSGDASVRYNLGDDFDRVTAERDAALDELSEQDRVLRSTVPEEHKGCTSPVGSVQNYIGDLEQSLTAANEREDAARAFVIRLIECAGGQPSIATGYLSDILDALKPAEGRGDE